MWYIHGGSCLNCPFLRSGVWLLTLRLLELHPFGTFSNWYGCKSVLFIKRKTFKRQPPCIWSVFPVVTVYNTQCTIRSGVRSGQIWQQYSRCDYDAWSGNGFNYGLGLGVTVHLWCSYSRTIVDFYVNLLVEQAESKFYGQFLWFNTISSGIPSIWPVGHRICTGRLPGHRDLGDSGWTRVLFSDRGLPTCLWPNPDPDPNMAVS